MISLNDCISIYGLTESEVDEIAEKERATRIPRAALADYLLTFEDVSPKVRITLRDDIRAALARGDEDRANELLMALSQMVRANG